MWKGLESRRLYSCMTFAHQELAVAVEFFVTSFFRAGGRPFLWDCLRLGNRYLPVDTPSLFSTYLFLFSANARGYLYRFSLTLVYRVHYWCRSIETIITVPVPSYWQRTGPHAPNDSEVNSRSLEYGWGEVLMCLLSPYHRAFGGHQLSLWSYFRVSCNTDRLPTSCFYFRPPRGRDSSALPFERKSLHPLVLSTRELL